VTKIVSALSYAFYCGQIIPHSGIVPELCRCCCGENQFEEFVSFAFLFGATTYVVNAQDIFKCGIVLLLFLCGFHCASLYNNEYFSIDAQYGWATPIHGLFHEAQGLGKYATYSRPCVVGRVGCFIGGIYTGVSRENESGYLDCCFLLHRNLYLNRRTFNICHSCKTSCFQHTRSDRRIDFLWQSRMHPYHIVDSSP